MRKYIFTPHERKLLSEFLKGNKLRGIDTLLSRIRNSEELVQDIDLFLEVKAKIMKEGGK